VLSWAEALIQGALADAQLGPVDHVEVARLALKALAMSFATPIAPRRSGDSR